MKILLAGATGVIGRELLPLLLAAGHDVIAISRGVRPVSIPEPEGGCRHYAVDVFDREALGRVFAEERPDAVMHQMTDLSEYNLAANARLRTVGTRNLVDAARSAGVRRIVAQSIAWAYAPGLDAATEQTPLDIEADFPRRTTIEGIAALENAASEIPQHVILRYGMLYGPGTWYARDGLMAQRVLRGEVAATAAITNFLHIADAAQTALMALDWPAGAVNIVDDAPAPATEWLPFYARELAAPEPPQEQPGGSSPIRPVSNARARTLGWKPIHPSWQDGFL